MCLPANPDVIVLADVATLSGGGRGGIAGMDCNKGGMLLRFAGPRLAASDVSRDTEAPLMPVRLRVGGRMVGGAMSWGEPKSLAPFDEDSPFMGLAIPAEVTVSAQVMAQPDPTLADRVIAQLTDGTPLVTRKRIGEGQVVLFHVTANAEWSSLPLSGLFVQMLERLAVSSALTVPDSGRTWRARSGTPVQVLDGFGTLDGCRKHCRAFRATGWSTDPLGPELRPGLYDGPDRRLARNVIAADTELTPAAGPRRSGRSGLGAPGRGAAGRLAAGAVAAAADGGYPGLSGACRAGLHARTCALPWRWRRAAAVMPDGAGSGTRMTRPGLPPPRSCWPMC